MGRYMKKDQDSLNQYLLVKKYGKKITVKHSILDGTFTILNIRKYQNYTEVDVVFEGLVLCTINRKREWYDSKIQDKDYVGFKISKIKLNRLIRKTIYKDIKDFLNYFCIKGLKRYSYISKISWK